MLRRRGVGLLGTMAVGGAAYAAGSSAARASANEQSQNAQIAQLEYQQQAQAAAPPSPAPAPEVKPVSVSMDEKIEQLQKLSELKAAGVLTDEELAVQKQKILSSL